MEHVRLQFKSILFYPKSNKQINKQKHYPIDLLVASRHLTSHEYETVNNADFSMSKVSFSLCDQWHE